MRRILPFIPGLLAPCLTWAEDAPAASSAAASAAAAASPAATEASTYAEGLQWLSDLLRVQIGDNSASQILISFVLLIAAFVLRKALLVFLFNRLRKLTARTSWKYDDQLVQMLEAPVSAFVMVVGTFFALTVLTLPGEIDLVVLRAFQAGTMTIAFWGFMRLIDLLADILEEAAREKDMAIHAFLPLLKKATRLFLIVIGVILVIQNLGYSVGSLLAGLGIGGLAVALAAQESLGNFFGSVSIAADRPFKVGDWIQVGDRIDGTVEEVGLRSTKVRTWAKSQLTIPNKVLAGETIQNWSRMPVRRVVQTIGVTYETRPDQMEALIEDLKRLLRDDEGVDQETILVHFTEFGASSLDIRLLYFTRSTAGAVHFDVRERINLKIMRAVQARGLSIAFPTRTVYLEGDIARRLADSKPAVPQGGQTPAG
jgi:MscS family membrane protein